MVLWIVRKELHVIIRGRIQKFPNLVDNEKYTYKNKHSLRSNTKSYGGKKNTRLTHETEIQLHLVAESCTIRSSRPGGQPGNFWIHPHI
jgi:hypothetical protein